jgi:hypothetical protein
MTVDAVVVGHMDMEGAFYCATCWSSAASAELTVQHVLVTETGERRDHVRIVDICARCGALIDYEDAQALI